MMKKWFIGLALVVLVFACTVQISHSGTVFGSNNKIEICKYDAAYRAWLQHELDDANHDLDFAQKQYDWSVEHNSGVISASLLLQTAQRRVNQCQRLLDEYDRNNPPTVCE